MTYTRLKQLKWKSNMSFSLITTTVRAEARLSDKFPNAKTFIDSWRGNDGREMFFVVIEFKSEADEAEFIMKETE